MCDGRIGYVFVGSTGVGKSSTIRLFAKEGSEIKVSSGAKSCTADIFAYGHKDNAKALLIDTIGSDDSTGLNDREIGIRIMRFLCQRNIEHIFVVWIIKRDNRANASLQKQAAFINQLASRGDDDEKEEKKENIWKSVVLVIARGEPLTLDEDKQGAVECVSSLGFDGEIPVLSYTCIDWLTGQSRENVEKAMMKISRESQREIGKVREDDVRQMLSKELRRLKAPTRIVFKDTRCGKCGQIGDKRCLPEGCHSISELYHDQQEELIHSGQLRPAMHNGSLKTRHPGLLRTEYYHSSSFTSKTDKEVTVYWHHPGKWDKHWFDTGAGRFFGGVFSLGISEMATDYYWSCCKSSNKSSSGCTRGEYTVDSDKSYEVCNDCGRRPSESGCKSRSYYSCCRGLSSGCQPYYDCCNSATFCIKTWSCCNGEENSQGCVYACCRNKVNSQGCKTRCQSCHEKWNDPTARGCSAENPHGSFEKIV